MQGGNGLGRITLNRPRALNALTQDMVRAIDAALTDWAADPAVRGVLLETPGQFRAVEVTIVEPADRL